MSKKQKEEVEQVYAVVNVRVFQRSTVHIKEQISKLLGINAEKRVLIVPFLWQPVSDIALATFSDEDKAKIIVKHIGR